MNVIDPFHDLNLRLTERKEQHQFRELKSVSSKSDAAHILVDDDRFINFSSNDYLGLSSHPALIKKSVEYANRYGVGSSSSRLISGTLKIHTDLEEQIASRYERERALLFNTGFQANSTILPAITFKRDLIIADKKCHNSILTGCLASSADFQRFRHNDLNHLEYLLKKAVQKNVKNIWIVSESLFSMDGDFAPIKELILLSKNYRSKLYIDDAHSFGVYGKTGLGLVEEEKEIDVIISTFGKAGGSFGAFVVSNSTIIDSLINYSSGFIYTTALPPPILGAISAGFEIIPQLNDERNKLSETSSYLKNQLGLIGKDTGVSESHIIPVIIGNDEDTLALSKTLLGHHILGVAVRPPTVAEGEGRIRLSLTTAHTKDHIDKLTRVLDES